MLLDGIARTKVKRQSRVYFGNALRTTRSTRRRRNIYSDIALRRLDSLVSLIGMKIYRGFPQRLHHRMPRWVEPGALFDIRIALDGEKEQKALTDPALAQVRHGESVLRRTIFDSAKFYEVRKRWHITLFLLMPDHLHGLLSFARDESMSEVIRD